MCIGGPLGSENDQCKMDHVYLEFESGPGIRRAYDSLPSSVQYMSVDHGRSDIFVTQKLLNRADSQ